VEEKKITMISPVTASEEEIVHFVNLCFCTELWSADSSAIWLGQVPWKRATERVRFPYTKPFELDVQESSCLGLQL
jgi:hypothetical protein